MNLPQMRNVSIVAAVCVFVGMVAWFKSDRRVQYSTTSQPAALQSASSVPAHKALPRLVDLGAGKCKACKEMAPIIENVRKEYAGRAVVEFIDVWKNPDAGEKYDINLIPTQIFYDRNGKEVWRHVGALSKAEIVQRLKNLGA